MIGWCCPDTCSHTAGGRSLRNQSLEGGGEEGAESTGEEEEEEEVGGGGQTSQLLLHDSPSVAADVDAGGWAEEPAGPITA